MHPPPPARSHVWKWWICGLLLLASTINYMDRQTLGNLSGEIIAYYKVGETEYGGLEEVFGFAFAGGSLLFGLIADRVRVRWLYPAVLVGWSAVGFATGMVHSIAAMWWCRLLLGLFEAGHWPCALRTTQRLLSPQERSLGNSVLQGGTSIGAIITPQIINQMVAPDQAESWRLPFLVLGAVGSLWALAWWFSVPFDMDARQVQFSDAPQDAQRDSFWSAIRGRRFLILLVVVICINGCWHFFRVWLIRFLEVELHYAKPHARNLITWFNVATEVGCLGAGAATILLRRAGATVHGARTCVFTVAALMAAASLLLSLFDQGPGLFVLLLVIGAGALALFPCFYSLSQELSARHQGKIGGVLGFAAWVTSSRAHKLFGAYVDETRVYHVGLQIAGLLPLLAALALIIGWRSREKRAQKA